MAWSCSSFREKPTSSTGIKDRIVDILFIDISFLACVIEELERRSRGLFETVLLVVVYYGLLPVKWIAGTLKL